MPQLIVFDHITLDGYFAGPNGDINFLRQRFKDDEFHSFAVENIMLPGLFYLVASPMKSWSATGPRQVPSKKSPR